MGLGRQKSALARLSIPSETSCLTSSHASVPARNTTAAISKTAETAIIEAERRRARMILARCPGESYRSAALDAIKNALRSNLRRFASR
jgi:hypothetical protein